jgi:Helix-turn-helix domain
VDLAKPHRTEFLSEMPHLEAPRSERHTVPGESQDLLRTADVAALFQVSTRTVSEWARLGRVPCMRTPGGQWRYPGGPIRQLVKLAHHESIG